MRISVCEADLVDDIAVADFDFGEELCDEPESGLGAVAGTEEDAFDVGVCCER